VGGIQKQIVLIDGDELTRLMVSFDVGFGVIEPLKLGSWMRTSSKPERLRLRLWERLKAA
jgi:hypothetical protein